ncbi:unnamed protein product [Leptidea sinapis]|uniref:Uncharacterized protein n=1 Tax=Leptidea sinapis TaxID=189913 RepID=A0A5E4Q891_9NEOP|nr:unnamed protein product [Leptidea sinapis]
MSGKTVSFNTHYDLSESHLESIAKWVSCNGEVWGMGPTVVFASAAALFLFSELQETVLVGGDHGQITVLEKSLVSTMVVGMLALMTHLWVCSMRFFQYYLDTLIRDSPNIILEMTTAGFLGGQVDVVPLGPLTRFLKQQQPQIHITICWFLSLCYADYVRKHYCHSFNMPYLEQWQLELHERATRGMQRTMDKVNSFVGAVHQRLRTYSSRPDSIVDAHTVAARALALCWHGETCLPRRWRSAERLVVCRSRRLRQLRPPAPSRQDTRILYLVRDVSIRPAILRQSFLRNSEHVLRTQDAVHRSPATVFLKAPAPRQVRSEEGLWTDTPLEGHRLS